MAYGMQSMLKEGHKHLSGLDEAVLKNIDACKQLSTITRTSLGPNGMNKMVINHLDKLFVTNDAATIVNELEVQHPAAKILVLASKAQQEEIGDGANLTISFAGELLQGAEELIRMGLHPSEIIIGYTKAINKTVEILDELVEEGSENMDVRDKEQVISRMRAAVASKQFGQEDTLCSLIADACIQVCPKNPANFNVDNVRVAKLLGGGLHNSAVVPGMVLRTDAVGSIKHTEKAKVAVFAGGVDTSATETKGTVLIHSAEQLENYSKTEEAKVEELIKAVADSGAKVIVSGGAVGEMALHFCERYKLMVLKISSKFELRRFCRTTGSVAMLKLCQPNPDDLGFADSVSVEEIGGARVTIVKNEVDGNSVATVVLRGSTDSILDDLERAVDDGVNTYKAMCRDSRIVPGAAATEIELAKRVKDFSFKETGLDQYAIAKFAESFEMIPRTLAENAGLNAMEIISSLYAEHANGNTKFGIDLEPGVCKDVSTMRVWDLHVTKLFALKYATDAACTVLRVDQIIMSKPAGGPQKSNTLSLSLFGVVQKKSIKHFLSLSFSSFCSTMKKLYHKATVHPSPPVITDQLSFLPATILTLAAALSPEDREVLAYLIYCSSTTAPPTFSNFSGNPRRSTVKTGDHATLFNCSCFRCYTSYWVRWDESPNRQLIHEIIDAFEEWLVQSGKGGKKGKGKKEKRNKKGFENKNKNKNSGELNRSVLNESTTELESVGESSNSSNNSGGSENSEKVVVVVADEEKGSVRKFVSFIGERIWGVWG